MTYASACCMEPEPTHRLRRQWNLSRAAVSYFLFKEEGCEMDGQQITIEDLERMAYVMAQAIPELDCPECCDCGVVYQYVERSAQMYREEWEWACLANLLIHYRNSPRRQTSRNA